HLQGKGMTSIQMRRQRSVEDNLKLAQKFVEKCPVELGFVVINTANDMDKNFFLNPRYFNLACNAYGFPQLDTHASLRQSRCPLYISYDLDALAFSYNAFLFPYEELGFT